MRDRGPGPDCDSDTNFTSTPNFSDLARPAAQQGDAGDDRELPRRFGYPAYRRRGQGRLERPALLAQGEAWSGVSFGRQMGPAVRAIHHPDAFFFHRGPLLT